MLCMHVYIDVVLEASPKYLSIEACNPGHGHEWEVFKTVKLPKDKVIMPGVLDTTTAHIEHPRLVAQRIMNYVRSVGSPEQVVACTDCGFSTAAGAMNVPTEIELPTIGIKDTLRIGMAYRAPLLLNPAT